MHERLLGLIFDYFAKKYERNYILDIGCGEGQFSGIFRPLSTFLVGCDIFPKNIEKTKKRGLYDCVVMCDASRLPFKSKVFDGTFASHLLEHLPREDGLRALDEFERVSERILIILPAPWNKDLSWKEYSESNPYEEHQSESELFIKELKKRGYKIRGDGFRFPFLRHFLYALSFYFPRLGENIIAVKD